MIGLRSLILIVAAYAVSGNRSMQQQVLDYESVWETCSLQWTKWETCIESTECGNECTMQAKEDLKMATSTAAVVGKMILPVPANATSSTDSILITDIPTSFNSVTGIVVSTCNDLRPAFCRHLIQDSHGFCAIEMEQLYGCWMAQFETEAQFRYRMLTEFLTVSNAVDDESSYLSLKCDFGEYCDIYKDFFTSSVKSNAEGTRSGAAVNCIDKWTALACGCLLTMFLLATRI